MATGLRPPTADEEEAVLNRVRHDPETFVREILGGEPEQQQLPVLNCFRDPATRRVAVKSGHYCGKDWMAARLALWFLVTRPNSIVVITGPTDRQVRMIAWGEVKAAYAAARWPIGGELMETMLKTGDPKHYMIGYTAKDSSSFQGVHAESVLVIVTEAQGISPDIWLGIESLLTAPESKLLLIGNALYEPESEFFAAFSNKATIYTKHTMDSEKSERCSKTWIAEMREVHGEDSPVWMARVKGIFPTDISDTLIPLGWVEKARSRWADADPIDEPRTLGADIARFGTDETVIYFGQGKRFKRVHAAQGQDLMHTVGVIIRLANQFAVPWCNVRIDDTGLGGGVTDRLREQGYKPTAINFAGSPADPDREAGPANARSELFWCLRERFRTGDIALDPSDQKLLRDLSVLRYKVTSNKGQIKLWDKAELKSRLGYSPDNADALALAAIPQNLAADIATGRISNSGMLDFMRERAVTQVKAQEAVGKQLMAETSPEAARLLGVKRDQVVRQPGIRTIPDDWQHR